MERGYGTILSDAGKQEMQEFLKNDAIRYITPPPNRMTWAQQCQYNDQVKKEEKEYFKSIINPSISKMGIHKPLNSFLNKKDISFINKKTQTYHCNIGRRCSKPVYTF